MHVSIISVGNELLRGEVLDTNSHWLSQQLLELGLAVRNRWTVGDRRDDVATALRAALSERPELILVVGGLGPTVDDLTRDGIAEALGTRLVLDEPALEALRARFAGFGVEMPAQNRRQVEFPEGAEVLGNPWGTAPSFVVRSGEGRVVALPGVPRETKKIFERILAPRIREWIPGLTAPLRLVARTFGLGESHLEERVKDLIEKLPAGVSWSSLPRERGNCDLVLTCWGGGQATQDRCHELYVAIQDRLGRHIFSTDPHEELDELVHRLMLESGYTLALAESCTGGLVSARLVAHAGCSRYLERAVVTYSNRSKIEELGVLAETLDRHGAVSEAVALEMARGVRRRAGTDIGASVTGIAGPDGATPEKPVGLVYWAVVTPNSEVVLTRIIPGDREQIRSRSADAVLDALRRALLGPA
jgi:competence/damage-inducible protein CinA-like protein